MNVEADIRRLLEDAVADGVFPGAQLFLHSPRAQLVLAVGRTGLDRYPESRPVASDTWFDVASLTKAIGTSVLLMQAVGEGRLALDDRLAPFVPEHPAAAEITLADLASHRAGLAAHRRFYETLWSEGLTEPVAARRRMRRLICAEPLTSLPGRETCYSDLGYILLGWVLEAALEAPLDELFAARVATPLGLERARFGPVGQPVGATEADEHGRMLWGRVHDENARALGGVAGHAGLFATASAVGAVARHLAAVDSGEMAGIVERDVLHHFWERVPGGHFTLGWDTPTEPSSSGRFTTRGQSVGHLGFTGCSLWHDRARDVTIVLLSNRVHLGRDKRAIQAFRPRIHDEINRQLASL